MSYDYKLWNFLSKPETLNENCWSSVYRLFSFTFCKHFINSQQLIDYELQYKMEIEMHA